MERIIIVLVAVLAVALGAVFFLTQVHSGGGSEASAPVEVETSTPVEVIASVANWELTADNGFIIGGYGDNFAYDGTNVRLIQGSSQLSLNTDTNEGTIEANIVTTDESGPIVMAKDTPLTGNIRLVMKVGQEGTRFMEFKDLHGDTGNEAPVMPDLFNYLAGWGPTDVYVDGELVYENLGGHIMFSQKARRTDGTIRNGDQIYSPMLEDKKTGFVDADALEFHFVAHTTEPDSDNFPPHTVWIHLVFQDVNVKTQPQQ